MKFEMEMIAMLSVPWLAALSAAGMPIEPTKPNVIVLITDDQGYGDLSCHGNPILKTPQLDKLHDAAIRFTSFHVAGICTPTRSQLLTGVDALRNRACQWGYGLEFIRRDVPTMGEMFGAAGYRTGQFGKWHLGDMFPHRPGDRGFQESVRFGGASMQQTPDHWDSDGFDDYYAHNNVWKKYRGYCADVFFNEAMRFMRESHEQGKPFLTYLATGAVHNPCFVPDKYRQPYLAATLDGKPLPPNLHSFFGMVANLDENVGRLEQFLEQSGLKGNTILIFLSDNGGLEGIPVFNAGMRGTKTSLLEGGHRQSCFIRWPAGGLRPAGDVPGLTQVQDLLPTLLELCGIDKPQEAKFDGISLAPLLRGQPQDLSERMFVVQWGWGEKGNGAVLWKHWRLTGSQGAGWQLHNLQNDPLQNTDVKAQNPDVARKMSACYEDWWRTVEPALTLYECPHIGDARGNPVSLTCFDYVQHRQLHESVRFNVTVQPDVRRGMAVHGKWRVRAVTAGTYRISLRRWPAETDTAITAGLPLQELADSYPEVDARQRRSWYGTPQIGVALPITSAKMRLGDNMQTLQIGPHDKAVTFTAVLTAPGEVELETWFYDAKGEELCSAPYAEITKLDDQGEKRP